MHHVEIFMGCCLRTGDLPEYDFEITEETQVHRRYLTLYNRRIRFPAHHGKPVNQCISACMQACCVAPPPKRGAELPPGL